ncbi:MAG: hypothetical protein E7667_03895 [Ruminococcaceae bacterium]|nr:hypothetical protein [Oscillospiraceae bacterium]
MKLKNYKFYFCIIFLLLTALSILSLVIFNGHVGITKYSYPAIALAVFHILYGLLAYALRRKGNYLAFRTRLLRHWEFIPFMSDRAYTETEEYKQRFNFMLAIYYITVPLYIPCIFFTASAAAMPWAVLVPLVPQFIFVAMQIKTFSLEVKHRQEQKQALDRELDEQRKKEEMGRRK